MNSDHAFSPRPKRWILRTRRVLGAAVLICSALQGFAYGQFSAMLSEDFEGLALGPFVSPGQGTGTGADWTNVPPPGWERDNSTTPVGDPIEFLGWTFLDKSSWVLTEGDQRRAEFMRGIGTVMVADPDAYDDAPPTIHPDSFRAFITTPSISLTGVTPDSVILLFDSSWRPDGTQTAIIEVSFDGGAAVEILRWESDPVSPNFKPDAPNELVTIAVDNPDCSCDMTFRFGLIDAGNNWWWAIDNVSVQSETDLIFLDGFDSGETSAPTP